MKQQNVKAPNAPKDPKKKKRKVERAINSNKAVNLNNCKDIYCKDTMVNPLIWNGFPRSLLFTDIKTGKTLIRLEDILDFYLTKGIFISIEGPFCYPNKTIYQFCVYDEVTDKHITENVKNRTSFSYQGAMNSGAYVAGVYLKENSRNDRLDDIIPFYSDGVEKDLIKELRALGFDSEEISRFNVMRFFQEEYKIQIGLFSKCQPDNDGVVDLYKWKVSYYSKYSKSPEILSGDSDSLFECSKQALRAACNIAVCTLSSHGVALTGL